MTPQTGGVSMPRYSSGTTCLPSGPSRFSLPSFCGPTRPFSGGRKRLKRRRRGCRRR